MVQGGGRAQRQGKRVKLQLAANASQGRAVSASTEALTTEVGAWAHILIIAVTATVAATVSVSVSVRGAAPARSGPCSHAGPGAAWRC